MAGSKAAGWKRLSPMRRFLTLKTQEMALVLDARGRPLYQALKTLYDRYDAAAPGFQRSGGVRGYLHSKCY
jgi:hypothetical protein